MKYYLLATVWVLSAAAPVRAQISPGPLSRAHEQWEGVSQCKTCHDFGAGRRSFKCLECHTEIQRRLETHSGYHARVYQSSPAQTDCARCHMEHNGQGFMLVRFDRRKFDHAAQTGFSLDGKHSTLACEKCHTGKNVAHEVRPQLKVKDLDRTFLGLRRECLGCHEDPHRGQEGTDCKRCHQQDSWQSTPGFNHSTTAFPLTGSHQSVRCDKCHMAGAEEKVAVFKGLNFSSCQSCHTDPHRGAFREVRLGSCESCHNTAGWKNNHPSSTFDHNRTKFALVGKHEELTCSRCHKDADFHRQIAHERCADCHEDPHKGQFASRAAGADCSACHSQTSYKPALFDRETHRRSAFPLEGKHVSLACSDCHKPAGRDAVYILRKLICSECHTDQHAGQFVAGPFANRCDQCHKQDGFEPSTFTVARHAETKFALTGKHTAVACGDCHKPMALQAVPVALNASGKSAVPRQYHFAAQNCKSCHTDPHQTTLACESCHSSEDWKKTLAFDHAGTRFPLDGAHQSVSCTQCHTGTPAKFAKTASQCSDCHAAKDVHASQFRRSGEEEDCSTCHTTTKWSANIFNHDRARFALDVAHRNVTCEKCHKEERTSGGKTARIYRGTPLECVKCH